MTMIIQAVEAGGRSVGRNFPGIEFAGTKSPDLAFSNVDRYDNDKKQAFPAHFLCCGAKKRTRR